MNSFREYKRKKEQEQAQAAAAKVQADKQAAEKAAARTRSDKVWERRWIKWASKKGFQHPSTWEKMAESWTWQGITSQEAFKREYKQERRRRFWKAAKLTLTISLIAVLIFWVWWNMGGGQEWWRALIWKYRFFTLRFHFSHGMKFEELVLRLSIGAVGASAAICVLRKFWKSFKK